MPDESTTPDRAELLRRGAEALSRRDFDEFMSYFAPHAVWDLNAWSGSGRSREWTRLERSSKTGWGVTRSIWSRLRRFSISDMVWLFVAYQEDGRPVGSNGRVERRQAQVTVWVAGVIERATVYTDVDEARAAAERLAKEPG